MAGYSLRSGETGDVMEHVYNSIEKARARLELLWLDSHLIPPQCAHTAWHRRGYEAEQCQSQLMDIGQGHGRSQKDYT